MYLQQDALGANNDVKVLTEVRFKQQINLKAAFRSKSEPHNYYFLNIFLAGKEEEEKEGRRRRDARGQHRR